MRVYAITFDLASPIRRQVTTPSYSDFGLGIKLLINGADFEGDFTLEKGGETMTPEEDKIDGYTVYLLSSEGAGANVYKVMCNGQSFDLICVATDEQVFEKKEEPEGPSDKYGITIDNFLGDVDANGVLQNPSPWKFEFSSEEIRSIPNGNPLNFIVCTGLTKIDLPNLSSIFANVMPPMPVTKFSGLYQLAEVNLPGLSAITTSPGLMNSFQNCTKLQTVNLPNLTTLGENCMQYAFQNCTSLESISLPNLTTIGVASLHYTFKGCTNLKYVGLNKLNFGMQYTPVETFNGCTKLEYVDFRDAVAVPSDNSSNAKQVLFKGTNTTFKVIVPDALYDSWIANYYWQSMAEQIVKASDYPVESL